MSSLTCCNDGGGGGGGGGSGRDADSCIPESWKCPLTLDLMRDPVMDQNGNSYERAAIEEWIRKGNGLSPLTRAPITLGELRPNRSLRDAIAEFLDKATARGNNGQGNSGEGKQGQDSASSAPPSSVATAAAATTHSHSGISALEDDASLEVSEPAPGVHLITAHPAAGQHQRTPVDICLVIDVSGSMATEAKIKSTGGGVESNGLSVLDVVKHGGTTIIESLSAGDRLSIVAYSSQATVTLPLRSMNPAGKAQAKVALAGLAATGSTNLWDGLQKGLDVLHSGSTTRRLSSVFLLTDGCPNIVPPRGHLPMLRRYLDKHKGFGCVINTYGFGYNLDSMLLDDIAREGHGSYSFIPDPGFVGTVFVNSISNLMSTMGKNACLSIEPLNGAELVVEVARTNPSARGASGGGSGSAAASAAPAGGAHDASAIGKRSVGILGGLPLSITSWGWMVELGSLRYGQAKDIVIRTKRTPPASNSSDTAAPAIRVTLTYDHVGASRNLAFQNPTKRTFEATSTAFPAGGVNPHTQNLLFHRLRLDSVDVLYQAHTLFRHDPSMARAALASLIQTYDANAAVATHKMAQQLLTDMKGQATEAFSSDEYFRKWGYHYVTSLAGAHLDQQCTNFKDPGLQNYGGELFESLRDRIDDIFNKLPPPTPSRATSNYSQSRGGRRKSSSSSSAASPSNMRSMRAYNCASAPCFGGSCLVNLGHGMGTKRVDEIKKGDVVVATKRGEVPAGSRATIHRIVKTWCKSHSAKLVTLPESGLKVTEWHPIRRNGTWCFPACLKDAKEEDCIAVYSFLLEEETHCSMVINGEECITLAHGIENDPVASHTYYGSRAVAEDIEAMVTDAHGCVELHQAQGCTLRDEVTGLVCKLVQREDATKAAVSRDYSAEIPHTGILA